MAYSSCWLYKGGCCYCYFKLVIFVVSIGGASAELQICQLVPAMHQAHLVSLCLLAVTTWKLWHTSEPSASHWMTRRYRWIQWSDVTEDINWCMLSWVAFLWRNPMVHVEFVEGWVCCILGSRLRCQKCLISKGSWPLWHPQAVGPVQGQWHCCRKNWTINLDVSIGYWLHMLSTLCLKILGMGGTRNHMLGILSFLW